MHNKTSFLYCDPRSLNNATNYYVGIIRNCLQKQGYDVKTIHKLSDINNPGVIITITEKYFFRAKIRYPNVKTIYWAQGVNAEEAKMKLHSFNQVLRFLFRRFTEPIAVRNAHILFCVSERMVQYYKEHYGLKDKGQIVVMPCYNLPLSEKFDLRQYERPIFAYAGNTSKWQGVDFMLDVYAKIEKQLPNACLRLFSKQKEELIKKCKERNISNFEIHYVPVETLQDELHKCKYGFIIRNNHIVNLVATPTKMNSYLAAYMIPVFSDGVDAFRQHINLGEYTLMAKNPLDVDAIVDQIIRFENNISCFQNYERIVKSLFTDYYCDEKYNNIIFEKMNKLL